MGGALAQQVALAHPDRVDSLVLISTSPAVPGGPGRAELPPMSEELRAYFDEAHVRALVARIVDRTSDMAASVVNHALAEEGELVRGRGGRPSSRPCCDTPAASGVGARVRCVSGELLTIASMPGMLAASITTRGTSTGRCLPAG